jgi:hypothetical protein
MVLNNGRNAVLILALVAVAGIGVAALIHQHEVAEPAAYAQPAVYTAPAGGIAGVAAPAAVPEYQDYQVDGYYAASPRPVYVQAPPPPTQEPYAQQPYAYPQQPYPQQAQATSYYAPRPVYHERYRYHRGRSKKHSIEIVAGSAAVGAAIGAIAGGGPGAAIGAIAGGAGGFAYDRATHKH